MPQPSLVTGTGDPLAWERLYRNVYPRLRVYTISKVGVCSAEDMVNETMTRAVAGIGRFKWNGGGFDAWLFGILRRVCLEHHRQHKPADNSRLVDMWVDYAEPGEAFEQEEDVQALREAFASLDESDRDILTLRLISGLSADEVAKLIGKSPGATAIRRPPSPPARALQPEPPCHPQHRAAGTGTEPNHHHHHHYKRLEARAIDKRRNDDHCAIRRQQRRRRIELDRRRPR